MHDCLHLLQGSSYIAGHLTLILSCADNSIDIEGMRKFVSIVFEKQMGFRMAP